MPKQDGQFRPGQSGNPSGRPQEFASELKRFTKAMILNELVELMESTVERLEQMRANKQTKPLTAAIASYLLKCRAKGEFPAVILDRVLGKTLQKNEFTASNGEFLEPPVLHFAPYPGPDPHEKKAQISRVENANPE